MEENPRNRKNTTKRDSKRPKIKSVEEDQEKLKNQSFSKSDFVIFLILFLIFTMIEWSSHAKTIREDLRRNDEKIDNFLKNFELYMRNEFAMQEAKLNDFIAAWSEKKEKLSANYYSVGIWYIFSNNSSSNKVQNVEASGVLYKHEGKCYIVSNYHTLVSPRIIKQNKDNADNATKTQLYDIELLTFMTNKLSPVTYYNATFETIYFEDSYGDSMDVAAINISCEDAPDLLNNDINIADIGYPPIHLYGEYINVKHEYRRPITDCSLIKNSIGRDANNRPYKKEIGIYGQTNCPSIPGYSGCGFYDQYGRLLGLHVGTGYSEESRLLHMFHEEKFLKNEWESINKSFLNQKVNLSEETLNKLMLVAKNTFSNIVYAKKILLLFETHGHINKSDLYDETIKVI